MLKVTFTDTPTEQKWILQGRLTDPWVSELWTSWTNARDARQGRRCVVDLNDVTFIDQNGETVLLAMMVQPNPWLQIPFLKDTLHFTVSSNN